MGKRILYITGIDMFFNSGGGLATRAFYNSLERSYPGEVDVIHTDDHYNTTELPENFISYGKISYFRKVSILLRGGLTRYFPALRDYIEDNAYKYELCVLNGGLIGEIIPVIKKAGLKLLIIHHNYEVDFQMDNKTPSSLWGLSPFLVKANEKTSYLGADINLFLTAFDKVKMESAYGMREDGVNRVLGIFEPSDTKCVLNPSLLDMSKIVIAGSLNDVQTVNGLKDFTENYLPVIQSCFQFNGFKITITGRAPGQYIKEICSAFPCYELVANPDNMRETLSTFGLFINPVNCGSGLKLRAMDPLSLGIPVLVHEVSARGYEALWNEDWFCRYQDKVSFEKGIMKLVEQIKNREHLRNEIQEGYRKVFSFSEGSKRLNNIIDELLTC